MADMMQFDLVSPERRLASFEASAVRVPASEGEMTVMAGHAPVIATLRPGVLRTEGGSEQGEYIVTGGFVEITEAGISVLAERAYDRQNVSRSEVETILEQARAQAEAAATEDKDAADLFVADIVELLDDMT